MTNKPAKRGSEEWKQYKKDVWTPEKRKIASIRQKERMNDKKIRQQQSDAWTPEMREKQANIVKSKPSNFKGKTHSDKTKALMSEAKKGKPSSFKGKTHTDEANQKNREKHLGKVTSEETKRKLSIYGSEYLPKRHYGKGEWYIRLDGEKIWLRSSYEIRVAKMLDNLRIKWTYESKAFDLGDRFYHPDFLLNETLWWEVKGWMKSEDKLKLIKFSEKVSR